jgi:RND family efflux transporter MFP subunit
VLLLVGLGLGVPGGYWIASGRPQHPATATRPAADSDSEQLYTCGMHPNVIQKGPGECPICHMKLTPLKAGAAKQAASQAGPQERRVLYWRAPMDPNYVSDKPGKSPMGMDLVPVYADELESTTGPTITIEPATVQNMGIRTTTVQRGPLVKTVRTVGRVAYDEQRVTFVDTKFDGWIEKLYVDETGAHVSAGAPLFDVYSPKLYSAQEEYLAALRGAERLATSTVAEARNQARQLVDAARVQLKYFDISDQQIDRLKQTGEVQKTLTIYSPAGGVVTEKTAQQGMNVKPGVRLYTIADLSTVWVLADVYEYQLPWVRIGQAARMTLPYLPDRELTGRVAYIYPYLEGRARVAKVRLEFPNPNGELKPDMYANVTLRADLDRQALLIPREAYIDSGQRQVAFVALGEGRFQPREIQVGVQAEDGQVEVLDGLDGGERVVTSGQFLLDAESKLKEAIEKMRDPRAAATADSRGAAGAEPSSESGS